MADQTPAEAQNWLKRLFGAFGFFRGTSGELRAFKQLNQIGFGGVFNSQFPEFDEYIKGDKFVGGFVGSKLGIIRNWHIAKFRYKGLPEGIDQYQIESNLFKFGAVAITKLPNDEYYVGPFGVLEFTKYGYPKKVEIFKFYPTEEKKDKEVIITGTVDEDTVILYHDYSFPWSKKYLGPLWKIWPQLETLHGLYLLLLNSAAVNRRLFLVPSKTSNEEIQIFQSFLNSTGNIIPATGGLTRQSSRIASKSEDHLAVNERGDELINIIKFQVNEIYIQIGLEYNNVEKKERVNTLELDMDNVLIKALRDTEKQARIEGLKKMKTVFGFKATVFFNPNLTVQEQPEGNKTKNSDSMNKGGNK